MKLTFTPQAATAARAWLDAAWLVVALAVCDD